jgi:magnesium chelatase family protein
VYKRQSLAHNGVLFLDEMPEFNRDVLEVMRQPLEAGVVRIVRMGSCITYPARFMLVAAMNPCRCGYYGDARRPCVCTVPQIRNYRGKVSGPLLDRIDLHINLAPPTHDELLDNRVTEESAQVRARVIKARQRQKMKYRDNISTNAQLKGRQVQEYCVLDRSSNILLKKAAAKMQLSARSVHRILKVAATIADLAESDQITEEHLAEALQFRTFERLIV